MNFCLDLCKSRVDHHGSRLDLHRSKYVGLTSPRFFFKIFTNFFRFFGHLLQAKRFFSTFGPKITYFYTLRGQHVNAPHPCQYPDILESIQSRVKFDPSTWCTTFYQMPPWQPESIFGKIMQSIIGPNHPYTVVLISSLYFAFSYSLTLVRN